MGFSANTIEMIAQTVTNLEEFDICQVDNLEDRFKYFDNSKNETYKF